MAQGGIYVFEADTEAFANRKRAARACASCQKRKKKCSHTFSQAPDQQAEKDSAEKVLPQLIHKEPIKFVGDLNPESVLTDLTTRQTDSPRISRIGVWVEQSRLEQEQLARQAAKVAQQDGNGESSVAARKLAAVQRYSKVERGRRTLTGHQRNYLQAVGALRVLPKATQDALVSTYVACIEPLLPIIDCRKLLKEYTSGEVSVFLVQAICLVACKTEEAAPFLRLYEDGPLMDPIPFARALHTGLDAAMKADLEADRFTKVQILTLMSLHNDGPGGIEESSLHLVMAIHDAQTNGLHINTPGRTPNDQAAMLWWTLWALDKFNACLGGRPLMIAERDIDIDKPILEPTARSQTMAVWVAMGDLLDKVIEFYRPIADPDAAGWEKEFPSFQELTAECDLDLIQASHRSLLEVCYNIIAILACRAGGPSSASYNRRIEAADRVQQLTAEGRQAQLPPLPLVPYAISLSLTVAYRGLRDSHSDQKKVQSDLATRCGILESVQKIWWTADAMAKLGRKALRSLQQPPQAQRPGQESDGQARKSTAGLAAIGDDLEAEVSPCKYGPFDQGKHDPQTLKNKIGLGVLTGGAGGAHPAAAAVATRGEKRFRSDNGNALHLLSDAAATHGQPDGSGNSQSRERSLFSPPATTTRSAATTTTTTAAAIEEKDQTGWSVFGSKRPRLHSNAFLDDNNTTRDLSGPSVFGSRRPRLHSNNFGPHRYPSISLNAGQQFDHSETPGLSPHTASLPTLSHPTPTPLNANGQFEINPAIDPFCATNYSPTLDATNENLYAFNDLDNLFDGFFDLSMPTMFQDPLFEGAAYDFGGGTGGLGSMDFGAAAYDMMGANNAMQSQ